MAGSNGNLLAVPNNRGGGRRKHRSLSPSSFTVSSQHKQPMPPTSKKKQPKTPNTVTSETSSVTVTSSADPTTSVVDSSSEDDSDPSSSHLPSESASDDESLPRVHPPSPPTRDLKFPPIRPSGLELERVPSAGVGAGQASVLSPMTGLPPISSGFWTSRMPPRGNLWNQGGSSSDVLSANLSPRGQRRAMPPQSNFKEYVQQSHVPGAANPNGNGNGNDQAQGHGHGHGNRRKSSHMTASTVRSKKQAIATILNLNSQSNPKSARRMLKSLGRGAGRGGGGGAGHEGREGDGNAAGDGENGERGRGGVNRGRRPHRLSFVPLSELKAMDPLQSPKKHEGKRTLSVSQAETSSSEHNRERRRSSIVRRSDTVVLEQEVEASRSLWARWGRERLQEAKQLMLNSDRRRDRDPVTLQAVLAGDLNPELKLESGRRMVRVYVSSSETDMEVERELLKQDVYPFLVELCGVLGWEFHVVDLRWGLRIETIDDHTTEELCEKEIDRCCSDSVGPAYMLLLGDKAGFRSPPRLILKNEFELMISRLKRMEMTADVELLELWYLLDENNIPPRYELQQVSKILPEFWSRGKAVAQITDVSNSPRGRRRGSIRGGLDFKSGADSPSESDTFTEKARAEVAVQVWVRAANRMMSAFQSASASLSEDKANRYYGSIQELEFNASTENNMDRDSQCYAFVRTLHDIDPKHSLADQFTDIAYNQDDEEPVIDRMFSTAVKRLKEKATKDFLLPTNHDQWELKWTEDNPGIDLRCADHAMYSRDFVTSTSKALANSILMSFEHSMVKPDDVYEEVLHHRNFAIRKCSSFTGREKYIEALKEYVNGQSHEIYVVYGNSGVGKTALMSKAAMVVGGYAGRESRHLAQGRIVITRFLGTTPHSLTGRDILFHLCSQITRAYNNDHTIPYDYRALVTYFRRCMNFATSSKHLIIFLDSLDQLSPEDSQFRTFDWLPDGLPPFVKLIVSTIPGKKGCLDALKQHLNINPKKATNLLEVEPLKREDVYPIIDNLLEQAHRTLTSEQHTMIMDAIEECPYPLFVHLAYDVGKQWRSFDPPVRVEASMSALIDSMFRRLEAEHGEILVSHTLALITASKHGLAEIEIEDILSCDDEVLDEVERCWYRSSSVRRIPPLLWVRIRNGIGEYLVETGYEGYRLLRWFHRQFWQTAEQRYLPPLDTPDGLNSPRQTINFAQRMKLFTQGSGISMDERKGGNASPSATARNGRRPSVVALKSDLRRMSISSRGSMDSSASADVPTLHRYDSRYECTEVYKTPQVTRCYQALADYFSGRWVEGKPLVLEDTRSPLIPRAIQDQPLRFPASSLVGASVSEEKSVNMRRIHELPHAQIRGGLAYETELTLTDLVFIEANLLADNLYGLVHTYIAALEMKEIDSVTRHRLLDFSRFLRAEAQQLTANPRLVFQIAHNQPDQSPLSTAAKDQDMTSTRSEPWLLHVNKERMMRRFKRLNVFEGHQGAVRWVTFSPDGTMLASASADKTVRVWDSRSGQIVGKLSGATDEVVWCAFDDTDRTATVTVTAVSNDLTVRKWEVESGEEVWNCHHLKAWSDFFKSEVSDAVPALAKVVTEARRKSKKFAAAAKMVINGAFTAMAMKDGNIYVAARKGSVIGIMEAVEGRELFQSKDHDFLLSSAFTHDAKHLACCYMDGSAIVFSLSGERTAYTSLIDTNVWVDASCTWSADSQTFAFSSNELTMMWNLWEGKKIHTLRGHKDVVKGISIAPDNTTIAAGCKDSTIRIWNAKNGYHLGVLSGHYDTITSMCYSTDSTILASGSNDRTVRLWDLSDAKGSIAGPGMRERGGLEERRGHSEPVTSVSFNAGGTIIATGSKDHTVRLWRGSDGEERCVLQGHENEVLHISMSRSGRYLATCCKDGSVRVWDNETAECLGVMHFHTEAATYVTMSPNEALVASCSKDATLRVYIVKTEQELYCYNSVGAPTTSCAFSPDGELLAMSSMSGQLIILGAETGRLRTKILGFGSPCTWCSFNGDSTRLVGRLQDCTVRVWHAQTGNIEANLHGHFGQINDCCIRGDTLATTSVDTSVRVWDVKTGEEVAKLEGHTEDVAKCGMSRDGRYVMSVSHDKSLRWWDTMSAKCIALFTWRRKLVDGAISDNGMHFRFAAVDDTGDLVVLELKNFLL